MSTFITLPTGTRINTAHLIHYRQSEHEGQIHLVLADEPTPWLETMTLEDMDALLSPPTSAIISPAIDLDRLKPGAGCQFTYEGVVKHGVIYSLWTRDDDEPQIDADSDGVRYTIFLGDGTVLPQSLL